METELNKSVLNFFWEIRLETIKECKELCSKCKKLQENGNKLWEEADKLWEKGSGLCDEWKRKWAKNKNLQPDNKLRRGNKYEEKAIMLATAGNKCKELAMKLKEEREKLKEEGEELWKEMVEEIYGYDIGMEWKNWHGDKDSYECWLSNGEVFKP